MSELSLTCGEALVRLLEGYGVDTVFGIPGVHTLELYRGLENSPIRHVLTRHEQGASFMADGYARATGKPGVCFIITGPGVTNASTGIAEAYADSQPMLVISSVNTRATLGKGWGELHEMDNQQASTAPFTAFSATAMSAEEVPGLIARAFSIFRSERPRPVHIAIPLDVLEETVSEPWKTFATPMAPAPSQQAIDAAVKLLSSAEHPAILVGGGAIRAGAALAQIAEKLSCPIATTVAGNGTVPDSHPLCLGPRIAFKDVLEYFSHADVVMAIGTEMALYEAGVNGPLTISGKLLRIDIEARKLVDRLPAELAIWADATETATALAIALPDIGTERRSAVTRMVAQLCDDAHSQLTELQKKHMRIGRILKNSLPEDTYFVTDMTQMAYTFRANLGFELPGHFFHPKGYGTLGYGLPAGIGVQIAKSDSPVIVIAGDGGFMYTATEMATAADEAANLIVLLWNNESLADIRDAFFECEIKPIGVSPRAPDFKGLARSAGWAAETVETPEALQSALATALEATVPTLVEVHESSPF